MIQVDISNIWSQVSLPQLLSVEPELAAAHRAVVEGNGPGREYLGWTALPDRFPTAEHVRILAAAEHIRQSCEVLVVIGAGGAEAAPKAVIELLQGPDRNIGRGKGDPVILFVGSSLSTKAWNELTRLLEGRDFAICMVSRTGAELESAVTFRNLRWLLERRFGTARAKRRIYVVTDPDKGGLRQLVREEGWESFAFPSNVQESFSVLTAAGLLPMAVAGLDVTTLLKGAARAKKELALHSFENPVWLYVGVRLLMERKGRSMELLESFEPGFRAFGDWWRQLFAAAEGKNGQGLFPAYAQLPGELYTLGQLLQEGSGNLFETMLRFEPPRKRTAVTMDIRNLDGLNYLADRNLDEVEDHLRQAVLASHDDCGCPAVSIECGALSEQTVGELIFFTQLCCNVSAYARETDPFSRPGVEECYSRAFGLLGRPE